MILRIIFLTRYIPFPNCICYENMFSFKQGQINYVVVGVFDLQYQFESITNIRIGGKNIAHLRWKGFIVQ